ncbi:peroxisome biogenesis factor 10-like [Periplaneta americana]|uniref:peroxisome biogenesis factor 10-like n=1 Tax=Periplaneta americana TaxID=6978 RepID=UPI0037E78AA8
MASIKSFTRAGQAEILRSAQKDDQFIDTLDSLISETTYMLGGNRHWLKSRNLREALARLFYYGFTTVWGFQTLGEEYTGVIQIDKTSKNVPGKLLRISMVLLNCGGELLVLKFLTRLEDHLKQPSDVTKLRPEAQEKLLSYINILKSVIPYLHRLHKGIFYLNGNYYDISKRLTGIKYILVRQWLKAEVSHIGFQVLGVVSLLYLSLLGINTCFSKWRQQYTSTKPFDLQDISSKTSTSSSTKLRCALCLEDRTHTTVTPCGHLFCWNCILEWVKEQQMCPLCREKVLPSRVVLLQNYEPSHEIRHVF